MPKKVGVFIDVSNLYYCLGKRFNGRKLDYRKYLEFLKDLGEITIAEAYGAQLKNEAQNFITYLKASGINVNYKKAKVFRNKSQKIKRKADQDVKIAVDIIEKSLKLDIIVLGSADGDMTPVVKWAKKHGIFVVIFACGISKELKESADHFIEIPESVLEETE